MAWPADLLELRLMASAEPASRYRGLRAQVLALAAVVQQFETVGGGTLGSAGVTVRRYAAGDGVSLSDLVAALEQIRLAVRAEELRPLP